MEMTGFKTASEHPIGPENTIWQAFPGTTCKPTHLQPDFHRAIFHASPSLPLFLSIFSLDSSYFSHNFKISYPNPWIFIFRFSKQERFFVFLKIVQHVIETTN